jgi:hypothetical protein
MPVEGLVPEPAIVDPRHPHGFAHGPEAHHVVVTNGNPRSGHLRGQYLSRAGYVKPHASFDTPRFHFARSEFEHPVADAQPGAPGDQPIARGNRYGVIASYPGVRKVARGFRHQFPCLSSADN